MLQGVPVSPGVAVARAYLVDPVLARHEPYQLDADGLSGEVSRFERACATVTRELDETIARVSKQVGDEEAAIFRAHRQLIRDPSLVHKVKTLICERKTDAGTALHATLDEYSALFRQIPDSYLQERIADLRDVVGRILAQLVHDDPLSRLTADQPVILVATEILPSQALTIDRRLVAGILTETGAATGHAAILSRALGIPAISGLRGLTREVRSGDLIAFDGREGHVYLNPDAEVESAYRKLQREYAYLYGKLIENRDQKAVCADGHEVELLANISGPGDAVLAGEAGAVGVGLYRTEYLFLSHPSIPDEEEQLAAYRAVIEAAPNRTVIIRTLDLGGDKHVPYLGTHKEANPFMGFRSIRLSSAYPEFFHVQLRAILRAGVHGRVSMMFPMVSMLEEVLRIKDDVGRTRDALRREGVAFADEMPLGVMIEVPAAALCIEEIIREVDFVSIGSNDLVQYLMAADRDNPHVAYLCEPFSPALLRLLNHVITTCNAHGKPVTLCGEIAGWPRCFLPLFGMGLRRLSMSPAAIPSLKELIRLTNLPQAREIARAVLAMNTMAQIRGFLTNKVKEIWPNVSLLDVNH